MPLDDLLIGVLITALIAFGVGVAFVTLRSGAAARERRQEEAPVATVAVRPAETERGSFRPN
ncbi:MAG: hypothetical protein JSR45_03715 [Proteobacteria bacterium]|nr:hypothetical protein [Pseudomonadota bacterium]